jgi:hypothetical protein
MKRTILIAIAVIILVVLALLLFWPRGGHPKPSAAGKPYAHPALNDGLHDLTPAENDKMEPILKKENDAIAKVLKDTKLSHEQKAQAIDKIRADDHEALKKILSPADYDRLVQNEAWSDGEALGNQ